MVTPRVRMTGPNPGEQMVFVEGLNDEQLVVMYPAADVLFPSSHDQELGLPTLNTLRQGTPLVVSNRESCPKVLGDAAWLVEPTAASLVHPLRKAISDGPTQATSSRAATFKRSALSEACCQVFDDVFTSGNLCVQKS